ncbi:MAG TPA: superoxide dismutase, partial [Opitutales bacterium]|nr:superoxide dismutase [Opitutales bacterium]
DTLTRRDFLGLAGTGMLASLLPSVSWAGTSNNSQPSTRSGTEAPSPTNAAGEYVLPPLPYAYNALEPVIDAETMHLHHDMHFLSYVKGLNEAMSALIIARASNDYKVLAYWENQLAFNGAGFVLHTLFFENMAPASSTQVSDYTNGALAREFGSLEAFKAQFSAAANQVQGSGWAILAYQPMGKHLFILQAEKHQNLSQWNGVPLLALDVWEHAYYLKYKNKRADYVKNWWNVVNWNDVEARLKAVLA